MKLVLVIGASTAAVAKTDARCTAGLAAQGSKFSGIKVMWATGAIDENEEWHGDWDTPQAARRRQDQEEDEIAKGKAKKEN